MKYSEEYMEYVRKVLAKYNKMISLEEDYLDYVNISFTDLDNKVDVRMPNERSFIDMEIGHMWDNEKVREKIKERQENALKWLNHNLLTFEKFNETTQKINQSNENLH